MNQNFVAVVVVGMSLLLLASPAVAQERVAENYDTKNTITLKGTVFGVIIAPRMPVCIFVNTKDAAGKTEKWVVEGATVKALRLAGWKFFSPSGTLKLGDQITISAWLPKPGSKVAETLAAGSPDIAEQLKTGRLAYGTEVKLPDGKKLAFGTAQ